MGAIFDATEGEAGTDLVLRGVYPVGGGPDFKKLISNECKKSFITPTPLDGASRIDCYVWVTE